MLSVSHLGEKTWARMTDEQLQGANVALRLLSTSTRVRGDALELLKALIETTYEEMCRRPGLKRKPASARS